MTGPLLAGAAHGSPPVTVVRDADLLAETAAAALVSRLVEVLSERDSASVVLTGGGVGIATLEAVRRSPACDAVDWSRVDVWWGDERFVPAGDGERNDVQARRALLDHVSIDPARVHPMGALGAGDDDVEVAAERYSGELVAAAAGDAHRPGALTPAFDVLLLGMGPEGHTASIFPESPAAHDERTVLGVHGCPKPPSTRITLGFSALNAARQVWFVVAGQAKAPAVAMAVAGTGRVQLPAAGVQGTERTRWLLDEAAAAELPGR